ncbi:hypothetical protein Fleli_2008 [Bernardetia litoralis DSM 6794]|uniref:Lipoprotein n=1 Tax=Bernardetia litoralis (strain ATCC 23117 / DSM 6794 / NBRC 15988 / NCIMB 1366 / Fx l1 / Sio-4) TaxID=880071 RepID=I4AKA7_BERLS|nr:hypothetical protein [Bernardetia litoralis]AFM04392.1 hypothetical protein Fleli_2008 [Bernardetia litoralis DSM 6794]
MKLNLILIIFIFVSACTTNNNEIKENNEKQDLQNEILPPQEIEKDSIFEESKTVDTIMVATKTLKEKLLAFSDSMLRKPTKIWEDTRNYEDYEIVSKKGLLSSKIYEKTLRAYQYSSEVEANNAFELLKEPNKEIHWAKGGLMALQKENLIIFLLKSCQNPPVPLKWKQYEQLFLEFILEENEEIEVLNTACGDMKFYKEIRRRTN